MKEPQFIPVLLGLDLNAYSVAISFYERFGVVSHAFGRYRLGITEASRIVRVHIVANLLEGEKGIEALFSFAEKYPNKTLLLIPCADWYHELMQVHRERLCQKFKFLIPAPEHFALSANKESFYSLLSKHGTPYPECVVFDKKDCFENKIDFKSSVSYPAVLKPSSSTSYWKHPFPNMKKVYFPKNSAEAEEIANRIFLSGYDDRLILQRRIVSEPPESAVLTVFCNREGAKGAVLARVLLEENAPRAKGNYSALITFPLDSICYKLIRLLEGIGYIGIANFDILYDKMGAYVLEMNARQGRSGDYVRAAGLHLSDFLVGTLLGGEVREKFHYPHVYWRCVSDRTVRAYAENADMLREAEELKKFGYAFSPFEYEADLKLNPVRRLYVSVHSVRRGREIAKYATGLGE